MADLHTLYAGMNLKNPVIVSSSGLTDNVSKISKLAESGAGAVVLKSLFEEQITFEAGKLLQTSDYPEAEDYLNHYVRSNSLDQYLGLIENAKKEVDIPVIASINCKSSAEWIQFARSIENAGADALELNVYFLPLKKSSTSQSLENIYLDLASRVMELIRIPVIFKLGLHFTNLVHLIDQLYFRGVPAVVLFNRFYSPDIDINQKKLVSSEVFSSPSEIRNTLRWVALTSHLVEKMQIAGSTGVHDGNAVIKLLLSGATAVQVCSVLYKKGPAYLKTILNEMQEWMGKNGFKNLDEIRGIMNYGRISNPETYERSQFMKYYSSHH